MKIAHTADKHLLGSQYGSRERSADFFAAAVSSIEVCAGKVDVICDCGDMLDTSRPPASVIQQLILLNRVAKDAGLLVLAVTGNHDWSTPTWTSIIGEEYPDDIPDDACGVVAIDGRTVTFRGVKFRGVPQCTPRKFMDNHEAILASLVGVDVALFHGTVQDIVPIYVPGDARITADDFGDTPLVLLGDLHAQNYVRSASGGLVGYSGSSEVNDASEPKEKSVPVIRYPQPEVIDHLPIKTRAFITGDILTPEDVDRLLVEIRAAERPVVVVNYQRDLHKEMARVWTGVGPDVLLRTRPLPVDKKGGNMSKVEDGERRDFRYFVAQRLASRPDLAAVADLLAVQGADDGFNIVAKFIEEREKQ